MFDIFSFFKMVVGCSFNNKGLLTIALPPLNTLPLFVLSLMLRIRVIIPG